jgi:hypothetical protein
MRNFSLAKSSLTDLFVFQCHELKTSQKEIEKLKYDNTGLDSKLKWHISKLKLETEAREAADKKIEELGAEINLLKLKEINRAKEEVEIERNMLAGKFIDFFPRPYQIGFNEM